MSGYLYIAGYILFNAYSFVLAFSLDNNRSEHIVLFFATLVGTLFFYLIQGRHVSNLHKKIRKNIRYVTGLSLSYGVGWLSALYALHYIDAATMLAVSMVTIPIVTFVLTTPLRNYPKKYPTLFAILCIVASMGIILYQNFHTMKQQVPFSHLAIGIMFAALDGVAGALNGLFSESLAKKKLEPSEILSFRFLFLVIITGLLAFLKGDFVGLSIKEIPTFLQASILMVITPLFFYQKALSSLGSIVVSTLLPFIPISAYCIQLYQGAYPFNGFVLVGLIICSLTLIAMEVVINRRIKFSKKLAQEFKKVLL